MEVGKLIVQSRHETGKGIARRLRAQGMIPGICYGHNLDSALAIAVNTRELKASLDPVKRQNTVITVTVKDEGNGQTDRDVVVMVKDYQIDPLRRELTHVDFIAIDTEKEVEVEVPLEFTGKHKGQIRGGQLHVVRHEMLVRCKPGDIPARVEVDVTEMDLGAVLHVSDLKLPPGISAAMPGRLTLITCTAPEAEAAAAAEEGGEAAAKAPAKAPAKGKK